MTDVSELIGRIQLALELLLIWRLSFRKFDKFTAKLHPILVKSKVWHTIGVDMIGTLPVTAKGNKYIMTVSEYFLKWPESIVLNSCSHVSLGMAVVK